MSKPVDVSVFFNFRSPYCYIASKTLFQIFDDFHATMVWRPLGGWAGRSPPERARVKIPLVRQDMRRITAKMGIPMNPPPPATEPTIAAAGSLYAQEKGLLREWIVEVMRAEWACGQDIGDEAVLLDVGRSIGLAPDELRASFGDEAKLATLDANLAESESLGLIGVPSFKVGDELFWGADRIEYVLDHLRDLRLSRL